MNLPRAPDRESVEEAIQQIRYTQAQSLSNSFLQGQRDQRTQEIIRELVISLSQLDQRLMGKVLKAHCGTMWITVFNINIQTKNKMFQLKVSSYVTIIIAYVY